MRPETSEFLDDLISAIGSESLFALARRAGSVAVDESPARAGALVLTKAYLIGLANRLDGATTVDDWTLAKEVLGALKAFIADPSPHTLAAFGRAEAATRTAKPLH